MRGTGLAFAFVGGLGLLAGQSALGADSKYIASYGLGFQAYQPSLGDGNTSYQDAQTTLNGQAFRSFSFDDSWGDNTGDGRASVLSGPGVARLSVSASTFSDGYDNTCAAQASCFADLDDFMVPMTTNPADNGKAIHIVASFNVAGILLASETGTPGEFGNSSQAFGGVAFNATGTGLVASPYGGTGYGNSRRQTGFAPEDHALVHSISVELDGFVGSELEMHDRFGLSGDTEMNDMLFPTGVVTASMSGDLLHTIAWGGVSSVTDANGNALSLSGFSMVSANTGVDYAHAVVAAPEPSSWLLVGMGLGATLRRRRPTRMAS